MNRNDLSKGTSANIIHSISQLRCQLPVLLETFENMHFLNCLDNHNRTPLQLAFKYRAVDAACVLLHFGADHITNLEKKELMNNYIMQSLKLNYFGLEEVDSS